MAKRGVFAVASKRLDAWGAWRLLLSVRQRARAPIQALETGAPGRPSPVLTVPVKVLPKKLADAGAASSRKRAQMPITAVVCLSIGK